MPVGSLETRIAFFGNPAIKEKYVARAIRHRDADEIVQSYGYWRDGKGCAIGCLAETDNDSHGALASATNLPLEILHLADVIFEGLDQALAKDWPRRLIAAGRVGADLARVHHQFLNWLLAEDVVRHLDVARDHDIIAICRQVAELHQLAADDKMPSEETWAAAAQAASAAANAAKEANVEAAALASFAAAYADDIDTDAAQAANAAANAAKEANVEAAALASFAAAYADDTDAATDTDADAGEAAYIAADAGEAAAYAAYATATADPAHAAALAAFVAAAARKAACARMADQLITLLAAA